MEARWNRGLDRPSEYMIFMYSLGRFMLPSLYQLNLDL